MSEPRRPAIPLAGTHEHLLVFEPLEPVIDSLGGQVGVDTSRPDRPPAADPDAEAVYSAEALLAGAMAALRPTDAQALRDLVHEPLLASGSSLSGTTQGVTPFLGTHGGATAEKAEVLRSEISMMDVPDVVLEAAASICERARRAESSELAALHDACVEQLTDAITRKDDHALVVWIDVAATIRALPAAPFVTHLLFSERLYSKVLRAAIDASASVIEHGPTGAMIARRLMTLAALSRNEEPELAGMALSRAILLGEEAAIEEVANAVDDWPPAAVEPAARAAARMLRSQPSTGISLDPCIERRAEARLRQLVANTDLESSAAAAGLLDLLEAVASVDSLPRVLRLAASAWSKGQPLLSFAVLQFVSSVRARHAADVHDILGGIDGGEELLEAAMETDRPHAG